MPQHALVAVSGATVYYDKLYTYIVPPKLAGLVFAGSMVLVPFGRGTTRPRVGVVMGLEASDEKNGRLKEVLAAAPEDANLTDELLGIVRYLKETTFCTWYDAVRAVIPYGAQYKMVKGNGEWQLKKQMSRYTETVYSVAEDFNAEKLPRRLTEKQQSVIDYLSEGAKTRAEICEACGVTPAVAENLAEKGALLKGEEDKSYSPMPSAKAGQGGEEQHLSAPQQKVADELIALMNENSPKPALLHGVTGSGKTLVFIELISAALAKGETALVLVPEIGLTPQMINRLQDAFGRQVAVQHSRLNPTQRLLRWRAIQRGEAQVVVGTRSAVFAPLENIGLIVIDEEQERSYQSESSPRYDAIEVAKGRAKRHGALLLLASATPSVASFYAAQQGRYHLLSLNQRYGEVPLPDVELVDMRAELMEGNAGALSRRLLDCTRKSIEGGGQVILLLNRRGYHRVALCKGCGAAVKCDACSVPMVLHKNRRGSENGAENSGRLVCHYCGKTQNPAPQKCPECGDDLRYMGFGTQKLEEELAGILPNAKVLRMDLDTTGQKDAHAGMLARFANGDYDILLGTQMVAKGLDFERVCLVGVIGIDSLLFGQGYRAYETVFSLVTQVVGRSGRSGTQGRAVIQTVDPQNPVLRLAAKQDYSGFYEEEIGFRQLALYPPFCTLCLVGFVADEEIAALRAARRFSVLLAGRAKQHPEVPLRVLGPAPMQVMQVAGSFRYRLTLKCRADKAFRTLAQQVLEDYNKEGWPRTVQVYLDFNADG